jgi:hypothetical protein
MMSTYEFNDKLYDLLYASPLKAEINGDVYKGDTRPIVSIDQAKEDVVIRCLSAPNSQFQETIGMINIHVPNLKIDINGKPDRTHPDNPRLKSLTAMAIGIIAEHYGDDWHCDFDQQLDFEEAEVYEHYSNIRVKLFSVNI